MFKSIGFPKSDKSNEKRIALLQEDVKTIKTNTERIDIINFIMIGLDTNIMNYII